MERVIKTKSEKETFDFAVLTGKCARRGQVFLLRGDLGTGKTIFAKGLAAGLGVAEVVNSPTFNIVKPYFKGRLPFYHIDAYRLENTKQDLGLEEYIEGDGVAAVEWPEYISYLLPPQYIRVELTRLSESERQLRITAQGEENERLLSEVLRKWKEFC